MSLLTDRLDLTVTTVARILSNEGFDGGISMAKEKYAKSRLLGYRLYRLPGTV